MHSYRSLVAWQQAHAALLGVLRATDAAYHPRAKNLFDQLRRATISIEANIVEGYALNTAPLCRRHIRIAIGSAAEAECLIRAITELAYLDPATATALEGSIGMALRALSGLMRSPPVIRT
jgi:four helix bundle protein